MEPTAPANPNTKVDVLLEWTSPSRPYKKRSREFFRTAGALIFLLSVILIFAQEFLLIGAILATFFVVYALSAVPPGMIKHKITNLGIETGGFFHRWEELYEFWFDKRGDEEMVVIRTILDFPLHLHLLLGEASKEKIKELLAKRIPYREQPERTTMDRLSSWLVKKIPMERAS